MLQIFYVYMGSGCLIYGMNWGFVGFLMNEFWEIGLCECFVKVDIMVIWFFQMVVIDEMGMWYMVLVINEVLLLW